MQTPTVSSLGVAALSTAGEPEPGDDAEYVERFGFTSEDVPALVELAKRWAEPEYIDAPEPSTAIWAPIHAWRALAQLGAEIVIPTLLGILDALEEAEDEWYLEELPPICARIGAPAIDHLAPYVRDVAHGEYTRAAAADGLARIVAADPGTRNRVCEALAEALRRLSEDTPSLNAYLISYLVELQAVEHAVLIERAFEEGVVNEMICGDWPRVRFDLGLGPRPPRRPSMFEQLVGAPGADEGPSRARAGGKKTEKAARKRQKAARKKSRGK